MFPQKSRGLSVHRHRPSINFPAMPDADAAALPHFIPSLCPIQPVFKSWCPEDYYEPFHSSSNLMPKSLFGVRCAIDITTRIVIVVETRLPFASATDCCRCYLCRREENNYYYSQLQSLQPTTVQFIFPIG
jgi:hypothetical protein